MQSSSFHRDHIGQRLPRAALPISASPERSIGRWLGTAVRRWKQRKMAAALESMDDRLLKDIGIYRNDIHRVVEGFDDRELSMSPIAPSRPSVLAGHERFREAA